MYKCHEYQSTIKLMRLFFSFFRALYELRLSRSKYFWRRMDGLIDNSLMIYVCYVWQVKCIVNGRI